MDHGWPLHLKEFGMDIDTNVQICQKYWWKNMLYINNLFGHDTECYGISWYLAVDTQLYVVAPIFLITLYLSPIIGVAVLFLCCSLSVAYTYIITIRDDLPSSELVAFLFQRHEQLFFDEYYEKPWARCPPYLIGLGVGYLLARVRGRKPRLHWIFVVSMWVISIWISLLCVYGPHDYIKGDEDWSKAVRGTYNNFARIGWSFAVSWVILANNLGWGGPIAPFMDHPLWQPLGRLSYCAYIVHFYIIQYVFNLDDRPTHYVSIWQSYVYRTIPVIAISYFTAFIWSCLFEVPTAKLEKMLFEPLMPKRKTEPRDANSANLDVENKITEPSDANSGVPVLENKKAEPSDANSGVPVLKFKKTEPNDANSGVPVSKIRKKYSRLCVAHTTTLLESVGPSQYHGLFWPTILDGEFRSASSRTSPLHRLSASVTLVVAAASDYVYRTIPVIAISYFTAFIWSCLFEVPTAKLEKMLFEPLMPKRKTEPRDANSANLDVENKKTEPSDANSGVPVLENKKTEPSDANSGVPVLENKKTEPSDANSAVPLPENGEPIKKTE
ncbi:hypothetical protein OSTOST_06373, partial [Ostertagia ostertagi]